MTTRPAVLYARVSSREQQQEGYSIQAQLRTLHEYASSQGFSIVREFIEIESAKAPGRPFFEEMIAFLRRNRSVRVVLVEKTDRLYRNMEDAVTIKKLDIFVHLVKENHVISRDAKSQDKLVHGLNIVLSSNYTDKLSEDVKKGMREKARQGKYPGRAPFGYRNDRGTRSVEIHPVKSALAKRVFELYATGRYSLLSLSKAIRGETGVSISKTNLHKMLTNPFYIGNFEWSGETYSGIHTPLITPYMFSEVQRVMRGYNRPKYGKHDIAFRGLLKCAHDDCTVTGELKKGKYVYYRCSGGRGPCDLPRFREQDLAGVLGDVLRAVTIPPEVAKRMAHAMEREHLDSGARVTQERARLNRELTALRVRMDSAYSDKLDGKISEEFWQRKQTDWQGEELRITSRLAGLKEPSRENTLADVRRIVRTHAKRVLSICYAKTGGTSRTLEMCTLELRN